VRHHLHAVRAQDSIQSIQFCVHNTAQHSTAQHSTAQHSTAQHSCSHESKKSAPHGRALAVLQGEVPATHGAPISAARRCPLVSRC
jgi:hypothetical protein